MKIVILDGYCENPGDLSWDGFKEFGELTVYDRTPKDKILERIGDSEIVITNKTPITRETIEACPNMKYIGVIAAGYNIVDVTAAKDHGIPVTNTPEYGSNTVAQIGVAHLLNICYHVADHNASVKSGDWANSPNFTYWLGDLISLEDMTAGVIGLGHVGKCTAGILKAMGMEVLASANHETEEGRAVAKYATNDEIYAKSDVIFLHCPLNDKTKNLINRDSIAKMKDGVIIINMSRGPVVNEQDLADALNSGKVKAAGIDVVCQEPINADNPLLTAKNCFITPHIGWAPLRSRINILNIALNNLKTFIEGNVQNNVAK